jgi:hypothetical protein
MRDEASTSVYGCFKVPQTPLSAACKGGPSELYQSATGCAVAPQAIVVVGELFVGQQGLERSRFESLLQPRDLNRGQGARMFVSQLHTQHNFRPTSFPALAILTTSRI